MYIDSPLLILIGVFFIGIVFIVIFFMNNRKNSLPVNGVLYSENCQVIFSYGGFLRFGGNIFPGKVFITPDKLIVRMIATSYVGYSDIKSIDLKNSISGKYIEIYCDGTPGVIRIYSKNPAKVIAILNSKIESSK